MRGVTRAVFQVTDRASTVLCIQARENKTHGSAVEVASWVHQHQEESIRHHH